MKFTLFATALVLASAITTETVTGAAAPVDQAAAEAVLSTPEDTAVEAETASIDEPVDWYDRPAKEPEIDAPVPPKEVSA